MIGLIGILGAAFAGALADGMFSGGKDLDKSNEGDTSEDEYLADEQDTAEIVPLDEFLGDVDMDAETDGFQSSDDALPVPERVVLVAGDNDTLMDGSEADDDLTGGAGDDQINARGGDDRIHAGAGNDIIWGGDGDDFIAGEEGDDLLYGGEGADSLYGGAGADTLYGGADDDLLYGEAGDDVLFGGMGDDSIYGGLGADWLVGGYGDDLLVGGPGQDTLDGGPGNDTLWGGDPWEDDGEIDYLNGGDGDDHLMLGAGDVGSGGAGNDTFTLINTNLDLPPARIMDFDPEADRLVVIYDAATHSAPALSISPGDGDYELRLDGHLIAHLNTSVNPDTISLQPLI